MKTKLCFQKLLSALLVLMMVLGTLVALPMTVGAADSTLPNSTPWDGATRTQPEGEGTKDAPWKIASGANLAWISFNAIAFIERKATTEVPVYYMELTANIDLNDKAFTPITLRRQTTDKNDNGTPDNPDDDTYIFNYAAVVFDGKGGIIKGLNATAATSAGLFSYVGNGSSFSNVYMQGASVIGSSSTGDLVGGVGALVGEVAGYANFYNVHVDATSTVKGVKAAGGIVGYINPEAVVDENDEPIYSAPNGLMTIRYCTNRGTVTVDTQDVGVYAGGIAGRIKTNDDTTIEYCANYGSVVINKKNNISAIIGGITGQIGEATYPATPDLAETITYQYLLNYGSTVINSSEEEATKNSYNWMGGISGHFNMGAPAGDETKTYHTLLVQYCFDMGAKSVLLDGALAPKYSVKYLSGNCADWQQDKNFSFIYGVPNANTTAGMTVGLVVEGTKAPTKANDCVEVDTETDTVMMNMTSTTVKAEMDKVAAAIEALGVAEMGGEPVDDGKERSYAWYTADGGTKDAPYEIANAADWAGLVNLSLGRGTEVSGQTEAVNFDGKYFKLTGDVDLEGYIMYPVGGEGTIHLDGGNHTISNVTLYSSGMGMFNALGRGSEIKNLKFSGMNFDASGNAGLVAANAKAGLTLYNVHADDTCSVTSSGTMAGGLIGSITDMGEVTEDDMLVVQFCTNAADVSARNYVAGLIGYMRGSFCYDFDLCTNKGDLTATATGTGDNFIGGLFANFTRNTQVSYGYITNCYNTGKLTSMTATGNVQMGALFGDLRAETGSDVTIENCFDYSARSVAKGDTKGNAALAGYADNVQLMKEVSFCYGANVAGSENVYGAIGGWTPGTTLDVSDCEVVESLTDEIVNYKGENSTMQAEMVAIDAGIADLTLFENSYIPGEEPSVQPPIIITDPEDETTAPAGDDTTAAPADDPTATEEEGCASSMSATFAVVAMTAICGMAIVGKKKED